jgi:EAL domain-containing protein (putative c-di-GMP-specific phosphodiesterase class I)/DNA-binding NarL/FixJ family response regulator
MQLEAIGMTERGGDPAPEDNPISVMIADDEDAIRATLTSLLSVDPGIVVIGEAGDAQAAIEMATSRHPQIALLDVRMPRGGGPRAAAEITRRSPATRVIALSALEDAGTILEMLDAGAIAYVSKGDDTETIVAAIHRLAEEADTQAKRARIRAMGPTLEREWLDRRRRRAEQIRAIIQAGGPQVVYQPIFDLPAGEYVGAEALSRFDAAPTRSPERWFEEADKAGLRVEMELCVIRSALADLDRLPPEGFLGINVSPLTCCTPELADAIVRSTPARMVLEITEHAPVNDYEQLAECLRPLRARGVRVAIDDTGAGFSSLSHVLALSPELIKLDIDMCRGIQADKARQALVAALTDFASHIGADVVAEGIESSEQLFALREAGVRYGQGFLLGRAQPIEMTGGS